MSSRIDFFYYAFRNLTICLVSLLVFSIFVFTIPHSSAIDSSGVDKVTLSIPVSCTLNATINSEHAMSMVSGTYKDNIGKTTMKTTCNDKDSYVIYAIGSTNDIDGKNTLSSIDLGEDYDIPTGLNTSKPSTGEDVSSWAMKLTPVAGNYAPTIPAEYNNTYGLIPNTWTNVASRDPGTFDMQEGSTFTTTYAIYTKGTQPAGTYTGQVKFALLHPSSSISPTTLERAFFLAGKQKIDIYDDNGTNTTESTNPTTGEPNTLIGSYYRMQDMTTAICDTANITGEASQVQLVDIRDNNIYWATKLLDNHCWMTQNLDLDLIADITAENYVALTSENTDLNLFGTNGYDGANGYICSNTATTTNCTANGEIITWIPERSTITSGNLNSSSWSFDNVNPYSYDAGFIYPDSDITSTKAGNHGLSGNYYNWSAAIADNNSESYSSELVSAANSACPKGWRLPNIANNDFVNLLVPYNIIDNRSLNKYLENGFPKMISAPLYLVRSGIIHYGNYRLSGTGDSGYYHYNTVHRYGAYGLHFSETNIHTTIYGSSNYDNKGNGKTIRCIAR